MKFTFLVSYPRVSYKDMNILLYRNNRMKIVTWVHFQLGSCYLFFKVLFLVSSFNIGDYVWIKYIFPDVFDYIFLSIIYLTWSEATLMLKTFVLDIWGSTSKKFLCLMASITWSKLLCIFKLGTI